MPSATLSLPDSPVKLETLSDDDLLTAYAHMRDERLKVTKVIALAEVREKAMLDAIQKRFPQSTTKGNFVVGVSKSDEPMADDWPKIIQYIKDTGSVDLLEKRLLKSGVKARWEDGESIPGVSKIEKTTVKVEVI